MIAPLLRPGGPSDEVVALHRAAPFTDVHAHPSLSRFLFGSDLWGRHRADPGFHPTQLRTGFRQLEHGKVGALWASHYVPEREIVNDCSLFQFAGHLVPELDRLRTEDRFVLLRDLLDGFEAQIAREPGCVELARTAADFNRIVASGRLAVVHAVEGAHVLEGDLDRLDELCGRGVACLTLAHFFHNGLFAQTVGIPPELLSRIPCQLRFHADEGEAITPLGYALLEQLAACPILVDVCHCSPRARQAVYAAIGGQRPVLATHVGLRRFCPHPYNLDEADLKAIAGSGGAVGLTLMPQWLRSDGERTVLDALGDQASYIYECLGSWDHVMIGSDFDGFTDTADDCWDASQLWKITAMLLARGLREDDVLKVIGGNAARVLREGWG